MENILSLDISRSSNLKVLNIRDESVLFTSVENYLLEILSPQKNTWITYNVVPGFNFIANASNLKIAKVFNSSNLPDLPDGVYELKISHKPNFSTYQHFYHFRITKIKNEYDKIIEELYNEKCDITKKEFSEKRNRLLEIYMDIMAAITIVEKKHDKNKGIEMYKKIEEDLKNFKDDCRCK